MRAYLYRLLKIEVGEGGRVGILLIMSFFMGVFLASISVASQSQFLLAYQEKTNEILPYALLISGALGLLSTVIYNFFQNRIPFQVLATASLVIIAAATAVLEFGGILFTNRTDIYFAGFVLIIPFTFITYLIFWGSFGRLFNLRQAKRLVGSVDLGAMLAAFIAYFSIPILLSADLITTRTLYTISLISIISFVGFFIYLSINSLNKTRSFAEEKRLYKKLDVKDFVQNRYIMYMSIFVVVSFIAMNFVDYSFLNVISIQFEGKPERLANFISLFEGTIIVFGFLVENLGTDRIIEEYGMRVAMIINPILIFAFTAAALTIGLSFGYTAENSAFAIFFLMISVSKLFVRSLKDSLDNPTFKLYLLPIEGSIRIDVQTKIEGIVTAFAMFAAGALIVLINMVKVFTLIYITIFTVPLLIVWYFVANKMYASYKHTLQNTLLNNKEKSKKKLDKEYTVFKVLEKEVKSSAEEKVIYALKLMEKLEPTLFENAVITLSESDNKKIKTFAEEKLEALGLSRDTAKADIKNLAQLAFGESEDSDLLSIEPEKLMKLSKSVKQNDRILACKLLRKQFSTKTIFILLELLRDGDPKVRFEALLTTRKVKRPETWPVLIEMLGSPSYGHQAAAALKESGEPVLPILEAAFHKSGQSDLVMLRIVQIIGRIGGKFAQQLLWRKADYPDKRIVKQILYSFRYINYKATGREAREVMSLLDDEISKTIWNIAAIHELPNTEHFQFLIEALREEVDDNYDHIFILLAILYDPQSVQLVRENMESGDPDNIAFAMELMELFIDQDLKPKLFPLLDEKPAEEKLKILQLHYPRESYTPIQVINYILNRDFNLNNRWTKVCAIHAVAFMEDFRISRGLVAQVFNSDKLLQETSAWVVYNKDKKVYEAIAERLPQRDKKFLDSSIENNQLLEGLDDGFFLWIEMVMFIKQLPVFRNIHGSLVCDLADKIMPIDLSPGEILKFDPEDHNSPIFIVAHGEVKLRYDDRNITTLQKEGLYGDLFQSGPWEKANMLEAIERSIIFKINLMDFYFVMANHHELVQGLVKNMTGLSKKIRKTLKKQPDGI
jgi:ATP:ADP antiporter, AAA family